MMTTLRVDEFVYSKPVSKDNIFKYDIYTKQGITDDLIWSSNCV